MGYESTGAPPVSWSVHLREFVNDSHDSTLSVVFGDDNGQRSPSTTWDVVSRNIPRSSVRFESNDGGSKNHKEAEPLLF